MATSSCVAVQPSESKANVDATTSSDAMQTSTIEAARQIRKRDSIASHTSTYTRGKKHAVTKIKGVSLARGEGGSSSGRAEGAGDSMANGGGHIRLTVTVTCDH